MKRPLISLVISAIVLLTIAIAPAQAVPLSLAVTATQPATTTQPTQDVVQLFSTQVLPQIETVLTPQQREQFTTAITKGYSFRKAFKSLSLNPEQKAQLGALFRSLPKRDLFASLTPEQKQQLFLKKKGLFMPTSTDITEKINAGMKTKNKFMPESARAKVNEKVKSRESSLPSIEAIGAKINARLESLKSKLQQ